MSKLPLAVLALVVLTGCGRETPAVHRVAPPDPHTAAQAERDRVAREMLAALPPAGSGAPAPLGHGTYQNPNATEAAPTEADRQECASARWRAGHGEGFDKPFLRWCIDHGT